MRRRVNSASRPHVDALMRRRVDASTRRRVNTSTLMLGTVPNEGTVSGRGEPRRSDAISVESNGISNRSNRKLQKSSNGRKIARMARILTIFGRNRSSRHNPSFQKFSNERKIIESIESIERSRDRSDRSTAAVFTMISRFRKWRISMCISLTETAPPGLNEVIAWISTTPDKMKLLWTYVDVRGRT